MRLVGWLALALAIAAPASAQDRWITLGTSGGPQVRVERAQIANALVLGEDIYLFDTGNDVQRQMARAGLAESRIRAIILSHHHLDHVADLGPLLITRWTFGGGPLKVIGPAGTRALVDGLIAAAAPVTLAGYPTGGPAKPGLAALVAGADLLVNEVVEGEATAAALAVQLADAPAAQREGIMAGITRNHLTPEDIGRMAAQGGVGAVLLTHFVPSPEAVADRFIYAREIGAHYRGPVLLAEDLGQY